MRKGSWCCLQASFSLFILVFSKNKTKVFITIKPWMFKSMYIYLSEINKWKLQTYPGAITGKHDGKLSPPPTGGLRSITPRPLVTQHNKTGLSLASRCVPWFLIIYYTRKSVFLEVQQEIIGLWWYRWHWSLRHPVLYLGLRNKGR